MNLVNFDPTTGGGVPSVLTTQTLKVNDFKSIQFLSLLKTLNCQLDEQIAKYGHVRGIGIAAPQVGVLSCVTVIQLNSGRLIMVNPEIVKKSKKSQLSRIGCLSAYQYRGLVRCSTEIVVSYSDENGAKKERKFFGDESVVVQHEIDHLNGVLILDRAEHGLFVPWELSHPIGSNVPFKNFGFVLGIRQKLEKMGISTGLKIQTDSQYYSRLFRKNATNYEEYIIDSINRRAELIELVKEFTPSKGCLLEVGSGTSSHSIYFDRLGYKVTAIDIDSDMLDLSKTFGKATGSTVIYKQADLMSLPFPENNFDTVFSHGVFEHFSEEQISKAINESLRVAKILVISVPTIFDISNNLMGDEYLWTPAKWRRLVNKSNGKIVRSVGSFPFHKKIGQLAKRFKIIKEVAPVLVLVVERR